MFECIGGDVMSILSQWQIQQPSSKYAQVMALLTLLWIALPLLQQLPIGVSLLFGVLMVAMMIWRPRGLVRISRTSFAPRKGVAP